MGGPASGQALAAGEGVTRRLCAAAPRTVAGSPAARHSHTASHHTHAARPRAPPRAQAYAAARFADSVLRAMGGEKDIVVCTYVESKLLPGADFFSSKVRCCTPQRCALPAGTACLRDCLPAGLAVVA